MISIRAERRQDQDAVRTVNDMAFGQSQEGRVVDRIRESCRDALSLVAEHEGAVVGHILFSPSEIQHKGKSIIGMGLAPMAVSPQFQNNGIGAKLVKEGLKQLEAKGCPFVIVLGHANYYPRFGFERASTHGIKSQWQDVPDDAFMLLVFDKAAMAGVTGIAYYRNEFDDAM